MGQILLQIFSIFVLGLFGGANPGAMLASIFSECLRSGFAKSLKVVFYALVSETVVAFAILLVLFSLDIPQFVFYLISFIGAGVLIWIATIVWKIDKLDQKGEIFSFWKIFTLTLFNGPFWMFWITICVPQAFLFKESIIGGQFLFLLVFEIGWLVATIILVFIFSRFRNILTSGKMVSVVFKIFSIILVLFSAKMIADSLFFFLK
jgi:threonine/homoserine/homoserine lactone efflux protein